MYPVKTRYISKNRTNQKFKPVGIVLHETASPNASDEAEFTYFNNGAGGRSASAHAFVDFDSITITVPFNEKAWHCGHTGNSMFIGIELCNYNDTNKFNEIYKRAVWLFAHTFVNILKITTITKDNLMSHAEVSNKWHESDHQDPIAYFKKFGKTVDGFRHDVQVEINNMINKKTTPTPQPKPTPKPTTSLKQGVVNTELLNCRALPIANAKINGQVKKGTKLNIYVEKDGFYVVNKVNPQCVAKQYVTIIK